MLRSFRILYLLGGMLAGAFAAGQVAGTTFNVKDYGAKGDGATDDTVAIREVLSLAAAEAKESGAISTIYFPTGTYAVAPQESDPQWSEDQPYIFLITSGNLRLLGDGPENSIISCYTLGLKDPETNWTVIGDGSGYFKIKRGGAFRIWASSTSRVDNLTFEGLRITGNATATGNGSVGGIPETGDGWDMSHKGLTFNGHGTNTITNVELINCHVDHWRGENVYAGGQATGNVRIINTHVYHSNASAISMGAGVVIEDSVIHSCYNAFENFALEEYQYLEVRRCKIFSDPIYGSKFGVVFIGVPSSHLTVEDCEFEGFTEGQIYLAEFASNVIIRNNLFKDTRAAGIYLNRQNLYPSYPYADFNDISIESNRFVVETRDTLSGILFLFGGNSRNENLTISNNRFEQNNGHVIKMGIWEISAPKTENRPNYTLNNNYFDGAEIKVEGEAGRAIWTGNTFGEFSAPVAPHWYNASDAATFVPVGPRFEFKNFSNGPLTTSLDLALLDQFPLGYTCALYTKKTSSVILPADPSWNNFTQDLEIRSDMNPVAIEFQANGKFGLSGAAIPTDPTPAPEPEPEPLPPVTPVPSVSNVGIGSISLSWTISEVVDSFELQVNEAGSGYVAHASSPLAGAETSIQLTGLGEGVSYSFRIRAVRDGLTSPWAETATVTTEVTPPPPPPPPVPPVAPVLNVDAIGIGSIDLSWTGGEAVDNFELELNEAGSGYAALESGLIAGTETAIRLTGLGEDVSYSFRIRAVRDGLNSTWAESAMVTTDVTPPPPPPPPVPPVAPVLNVDAVGIGSVDLSWTVGEAVDNFELQLNEAGSGYVALESGLIAGTETTIRLTGLGEGIDYSFRIRSSRDGLASSWTESAVVTTLAPEPEPVPAPPTDPVAPASPVLNVDSVGVGTATLSWILDETVDRFEIEARQPGSNYLPVDNGIVDGGARSLKVTGLEPGGRYSFQIRAIRGDLASDWAKTGNVKLEAGTPDPSPAPDPSPTPDPQPPVAPNLAVDAVGIGSVTLSWNSPEAVDSFELEYNEAGSGYVAIESGQFAGNENGVLLEGLMEGTGYTFRLKSVRDGLASAWVESESVITLVTPPVTPEEEVPVVEASHFWTFDGMTGTLVEDSGLSSLALDASAASLSVGVGSSNAGILFSGNHTGIAIPDSATINADTQSELTISLWVRPAAASADLTSVIYEQGSYWRGLNLILDHGWLQASGWNRPQKESDWAGTTLDGGKLVVGEWNHIALVLSAGPQIEQDGLKLYVNGQLVATGPASQLWKQNDDNGIGQVQQSTVYQDRQIRSLDAFQGGIDEVSIWNTPLSEQEIQDLILLSAN